MQSFGITDTGSKRSNNEDSLLLNRNLSLFMVADGMGGHACGEIASRMAVRGINDILVEALDECAADLPGGDEYILRLLQDALTTSNEAIFSYSQEMAGGQTMGTTLSLALFRKGSVYLAHVGDSRIYRFREGNLEKLTTDHNAVQALVERGLIAQEDADNHSQSQILTQALGARKDITPEIQCLRVEDKDQYLLCSDGLSRVLNIAAIAEILGGAQAVSQKCRILIDRTLEGGAPDNVTVIVVSLQDSEEYT